MTRPAALGLLLLLLGSQGGCRSAPVSRPNILLITADDMSAEDCEPCGHPGLRTPNLAALAAAGMRFDRAFLTSGSCSPSRCSTLTGRYPHATGAGRLHDPLPAEQVTFLEGLRAAGYYTAIAGKWHLGKPAHGRFEREYAESAHGDYTEWRECLRERPRDRPFFIWLSASDPHRPYTEGTLARPHLPEDAVVPAYLPDDTETRLDLARYYDAISRLDGFVGEALAELEGQGVAGDTLVLFLSDNGRPFPRCKPTLYDGGVRTPFFVRFPGRVRPGTSSASLVSAVDIAPTFLQAAGVTPPATIQGTSLLPLFADPNGSVRDQVFAEHNWHDHPARERMVRTARYKYIRNYYPDLPATPPEDVVRSPTFHAMKILSARSGLTPAQANCFLSPRPTEELYDVASDPDELHNLAGDPSQAAMLEQMRRRLEAWRRDTDDTDTAVTVPAVTAPPVIAPDR